MCQVAHRLATSAAALTLRWATVLGVAAIVTGVLAGILDVLEDLTILEELRPNADLVRLYSRVAGSRFRSGRSPRSPTFCWHRSSLSAGGPCSASQPSRPPPSPRAWCGARSRNEGGTTLEGMAVVIASNLRKELAGDVLFDGVSFKVERRDRVALSGPNGAGKTTLLRILVGETELQGGELAFQKGTRVALHDQRPPLERDLSLREYVLSGATDLVAAEQELRRLEDAMAGGDHADATLRRYSEAQARLEHAAGRSTFFAGPWHAWREEKAARALHAGKAVERYEEDIARLRRFVERFRYKKTKAKQAQAKLTQISRLERDRVRARGELELLTRRSRSLGFEFLKPARSGRTVAEARELEVGVGDRVLLRGADLALERGEHVALVGPNGSGKTTLLEMLLGLRERRAGTARLGHGVESAYFSQHEVELPKTGSVLDAARTATCVPTKAAGPTTCARARRGRLPLRRRRPRRQSGRPQSRRLLQRGVRASSTASRPRSPPTRRRSPSSSAGSRTTGATWRRWPPTAAPATSSRPSLPAGKSSSSARRRRLHYRRNQPTNIDRTSKISDGSKWTLIVI